MAASWSKVTAEELEKAMADLDDVYARIPEEYQFYRTETEEWIKRSREREEKKKKELRVMPPHKVQMVLNYKCGPLPERKAIDSLVAENKEKYKDLGTLVNVSETLIRHHYDLMRACQEKVRHELATKGYATYVAADEDEEEEQEAVVHQRFQGGGGGRRRPCPEVTESGRGGAVRRLN